MRNERVKPSGTRSDVTIIDITCAPYVFSQKFMSMCPGGLPSEEDMADKPPPPKRKSPTPKRKRSDDEEESDDDDEEEEDDDEEDHKE